MLKLQVQGKEKKLSVPLPSLEVIELGAVINWVRERRQQELELLFPSQTYVLLFNLHQFSILLTF